MKALTMSLMAMLMLVGVSFTGVNQAEAKTPTARDLYSKQKYKIGKSSCTVRYQKAGTSWRSFGGFRAYNTSCATTREHLRQLNKQCKAHGKNLLRRYSTVARAYGYTSLSQISMGPKCK